MSAPLDDEFQAAAPPPLPEDRPEVKLRRSGPDSRWQESHWRWYVYLDDEVLGYLDAKPVRHRPVEWLPKAMSGFRVSRPGSLHGARDQLVSRALQVPGRRAFVCPVCGGYRPHHDEVCPLVTPGLFDFAQPEG